MLYLLALLSDQDIYIFGPPNIWGEVCFSMCMSVLHACVSVYYVSAIPQKRVPGPLGLELQIIVTHHVSVSIYVKYVTHIP